MGPMGRGRYLGSGGRFEPGHYRGGGGGRGGGGRGFPNFGAAARGPRDGGRGFRGRGGGGGGVGRPPIHMDPLGRGRGEGTGGGREGRRHDFHEPPYSNNIVGHPHPATPPLGPLHPKERGRLGVVGMMDGRFSNGPRDAATGGGGRVPFRGGRGRMFRGGGGGGAVGGRLDGPDSSGRGPPMRDSSYFGAPGFRHPNIRGAVPDPPLGPDRYGPLGSTAMSQSSSPSTHPKDDEMASKYENVKHTDSMGRSGDDRSESSSLLVFNKRSLPTYSSMSEIVDEVAEGKESNTTTGSRNLDTPSHDVVSGSPISESSFVTTKKTRYESNGSIISAHAHAHAHDYSRSPADNHDSYKMDSNRVSTAYEMSGHDERDPMEQRETNRQHVPFDSGSGISGFSGRGGRFQRGGMYRGTGGSGGRMPSFVRGRGAPPSYPYNPPYSPANPSDVSIAGSDGYSQDNKDYLSRKTNNNNANHHHYYGEDSGRGNGGPGMGMGMGRGLITPPFHRGTGGGGGERSYGMGARGRWGARNVGRHYPTMDNSGTFTGRGQRISEGGRGFLSSHRSAADHHYSSRSALHGKDENQQHSHYPTSSLSQEREHHHTHHLQRDQHHHYKEDTHRNYHQQQYNQQQEQNQNQQEQEREQKQEHNPAVNETIVSLEKSSSRCTESPTKEINEEPVDIVPPSPPPAPPSALALARARLSDLNETMEFHYARHLQITKEHEIIQAKVETLKQLPIGVEAFQDDLSGINLLLQGNSNERQ